MLWCSGDFLGAFAQDTTIRSGFAVVTLVSGNIAGLIGTETIRNQTGSGTEQAIASPAPLVTGASILVPVDPVVRNTTSVALANPSLGSGSVNLVLTDANGTTISNVVVTLQPRTQVSRFLSDFFGAQLASSNPLLLTISSEIPIGIGAFNFRDNDFTSVPLTSLSFPTPVSVQAVATVPATTVPVTTVQPVTTIQPVTTVQPVQVVQTPIQVVQPMQPVTATPPGSTPGFGLGLPPEPTAITTVTQPISVTGIPLPAPITVTVPSAVSTVAPTTPVAVVPADVIGGPASLVFPQIVTGGGWSTELAIGNTSAGSQSVRIDFFGSDGVVATSLTNVLIPPRGVAFFTADLSAIGQ